LSSEAPDPPAPTAGDDAALGAAVSHDGHRLMLGSCSWADRTLVQDADWYPRRTMSAEERLRYYATQFPLTEIDSTYYAPPSEAQARLWTERTPTGFRFDVKAYSLLTGHPTRPQSLWRDIREHLSPDVAGKRNVYAHHLDPDTQKEVWRRFDAALRPLHDAGKLGAVLFQYPAWFTPRRDNRAELQALRERLPDYRLCVELRSPRWTTEPRDRERTLALLRDCDLAFVCVDAPAVSGLPWVLEVTDASLLVVRFHGRNDETWNARTATAAERFRYLYSQAELAQLAPQLIDASEAARETHLLMNNCYRDYSVRNAGQLRELLQARPG
jgi:uncharacterized protein YecE (DUF72 family)